MADTGERGPNGKGRESGATSRWESVIAVVGVVLVVGALAVVLRGAMMDRRDPLPRIAVRVDTIAAYESGFVVRLRVVNAGGGTAARLVIHGALEADTGAVERSETTVDYVPARSAQQAGLLFTKDPRAYRLEVRAVGYEEP